MTAAFKLAPPTPSFDELYEAELPFVWRTLRAFGVPEDRVEDAAQDAFVVVHRKLDEFEGRASIRTWLFAIVRRVAQDYRRREHRKGGHAQLQVEVSDNAPSPREAAERSEAARLLVHLLETIDEDKRAVFALVELEQMTVPEAAEALSVNVNTAYSRLRAARMEFEAALRRQRDREGNIR